ncbi:alpha/beta hydrolase family esterase [Piscinibacter sp.]|uniref:extracellular catalytic domain type 1 short-chain-length polyhydroxyalkanoate depolymerase n=1 Tax=Piscinibacter sp. TaxID=1903157 RepID=UPI002D80261D|nr:PHB depolymerase family esterase [Albitalea sp.]
MKKSTVTGIVVSVLLLACSAPPVSQTASAQEDSSRGTLRDRIKQRLLERQQQKPAPQASTDARSKISQPGDYTFSIVHGGLTRMYRVHVPSKYDPAKPAPVVFAFHGGGANMEYQATDENYGQVAKSEREGFIVVFPNGYSKLPSGKFATWNAGTCCAAARDENVDDVGFVKTMIDNLGHQLNIDRGRIFATGMSNGGMLAYRVACEMADTFKAIASVAGPDGTTSCNPSRPISILHIHAKNDDHAQFAGGAGPKSQERTKVTNFRSVPETISRWVAHNSCSPTPKRVLEKPGAYCDAYQSCRGGVEVRLCVTDRGGHSWPGAAKTRGEPASTAISANDAMWEFWNRQRALSALVSRSSQPTRSPHRAQASRATPADG